MDKLKLFVGIPLSDSVTSQLAKTQPPPTTGIRNQSADQMHLTLHFVGEGDVDRLVASLQSVKLPQFQLAIRKVGSFPTSNGTTTLWAGLEDSSELISLRDSVGGALTSVGHELEGRPYNPHIALARCEKGTAGEVIERFLSNNGGINLIRIPVATFALFSSRWVDGVPVYRVEHSFPLSG